MTRAPAPALPLLLVTLGICGCDATLGVPVTHSFADTASSHVGGMLEGRIHVAASYKVSDNTQVRAEFEVNAQHVANYRKIYPENASYWNRTTFNTDNTVIPGATASAAGIGQVSANTDYLLYNYGAPSLGFTNYRGAQYRSNGTGFGIPWRGRDDHQIWCVGEGGDRIEAGSAVDGRVTELHPGHIGADGEVPEVIAQAHVPLEEAAGA